MSEPGRARAANDGSSIWQGRLGLVLQILGLLFAAYVLVTDVNMIADETGLLNQHGVTGARFDRAAASEGFLPVVRVATGSAMADAGVAVGDKLRFDNRFDHSRHLRPGESVGFTRLRAGQSVHMVVNARPRPPVKVSAQGWMLLAYDVSTTTAVLFGAFIIWRSRRNPTTMMLGMGLVTYGLVDLLPPPLFSDLRVFVAAYDLNTISYAAIPILFYGFALRFYRDNGGLLNRIDISAFWVFAAAQACSTWWFSATYLWAFQYPLIGDGTLLQTVIAYAGFVCCVAYLVRGWRGSGAAAQQRYALLLVATVAVTVAQGLDTLSQTQNIHAGSFVVFHLVTNSLLTGVIASGLFTYSILRHRVFDLGFAVNRTLVYGLVSAILLVAFGLVEWASDHFLPLAGREKNAVIDAAVALAIFLTFHRLRDGVEHVIETLFFRAWRQKEAALKKFVAEAAYILKPEALEKAAIRALVRFADGAEAALYLRNEAGGYGRVEGRVEGPPALLDEDDAVVVALRAGREPLEGEAVASLPGAEMALPMLSRAEVTGFVLLGAKPSGLPFRPDEVEQLGWAASQIGLDLHALKVERLEALTAKQAVEIAALSGRGAAGLVAG